MADKLKIIGTFAITFITICAGIYHMVYWSEFGINILSYIDLSDIIKSFLMPSAPFIFITTILIFYFLGISSHISDTSKVRTFVFKHERIINGLIFSLIVSITSYLSAAGQLLYWYFWPFLVYSGISTFPLIKNIIPQIPFIPARYRHISLFFILTLPLLSYSSGKYNSLEIRDNLRYYYSVKNNKDTLKYIGKAGNYHFFTDRNNSRNYIMRAEKIDTLVLFEFRKK